MISAVVPLRPMAHLQPLPKPSPVVRPSVRDRAAAGYFRDLALWLNEPLVNQGVFVLVQADHRPGCLRLIVEFERSPIRDRLTRFLCHRIWQLNSDLIEGIYILARPVGWQRVLWKQRIKISTPALRRRRTNEQLTQVSRTGSTLATPRRSQRRRVRRRTAVPLTPFSPTASTLADPRYTRRRRVRRYRRRGMSRQLKTLRALMLTGSAVAAFVLGCLLEVMGPDPSMTPPTFSAQATQTRRVVPGVSPQSGLEGHGSLTAPSLSSGGDDGTIPPVGRSGTANVTPAEFPRPPRSGGSPRPSVVDTALEPVVVIPHAKPSPTPADEVTLLFGGDVSLDALNFDQLKAEGGLFTEVEDYLDADVSLVNLASPLATAATSLDEEFRQQLRPEAAHLLADSGVDIVNLTHSRLMEYGAEGLTETLTALDSNGLYRVGAGRNATEARRPEILDVKGKRIAYLSYAMGGNDAAIDTTALRDRAGADDEAVARELANFQRSTAFQERAGFNAQNMPEIVQDIQAIRDQVDWVVVNFRWVDHLEETPNFVQTNLARLAIDQGADLVVGYHPTVVQGGEIYKGRPIAYSLGDFVFKPDQPLQDQDSAMLKVSLHEDQMQVEFVPVRVRDSRPQTLTGAEGQEMLQRIETASAQFEEPLQPLMVLDLHRPAGAAPETQDPNSPFVQPGAEDSLILETGPSVEADTPAPGAGASDPSTKEVPGDSANPGAAPGLAEGILELPIPEGELGLDWSQPFDQDLLEWGPKVSPEEQKFMPVPQQRSEAEAPHLGAQGQPVPPSPLAQAPTPTRSEDRGANPSPAASTSASPTAERPPLMRSVATPEKTRPTPAITEVVEAVPEREASSPGVEKASPETKVIPPQAEPLVGPLSSTDDATDMQVALGALE